uniref:Intraflagellar transport protein 46 homolog n=1 Tax=Loa loa TaxID=7209 RepID=A0A1I7V6H4_LOALO
MSFAINVLFQFIKENISALDDDNNLVSGISAIGAMIQGVTDLATVTTTIATGNDVNDITKSENEDKKFRANVSTILSADVKQLLSYVESYTPKMIHIEPILKPFLIDYIPAVGDVEDDLGLVLLDEPAMEQSDPIILNLKMRNELKDHTNMLAKDIPVKKLERADENIEEIEHWISSIKEIHRTKPSDIVIYTKPMPNIEHLMQEWPIEVENLLKNEQVYYFN